MGRLLARPATAFSYGTCLPLRALIDPFVHLCLFRIGPQDLPTSTLLLGIVIATNTLVSIVALAIQGFSMATSVVGGVLDSGLMVGLIASLLITMRQPARLVQTLTATLGLATLIGLLVLPLLIAHEPPQPNEAGSVFPELLHLLAVGWFVAAIAHVLRHALAVNFGVALLVAFVLFALSNLIFASFLQSMATSVAPA